MTQAELLATMPLIVQAGHLGIDLAAAYTGVGMLGTAIGHETYRIYGDYGLAVQERERALQNGVL
jgi:hypothetical protein